jgi:ferredoxin
MSRSRRAVALLLRLWPLGRTMNRLARLPVLGLMLRPFYGPAANEAIIIPVHETVSGTESVTLPLPLLTPLVESASGRFILEACLCRRAEGCQNHPVDIGCLFLGDAAAAIHPELGRPTGVPEALAHVQRALEAGLVPMVVHASFDAWILGIPYRRMLAVCFCCDCCCTVRHGLREGPPAFWETVRRLPGLSVEAGPECVACGTCLEACPVGVISLEGGRARVGAACKGCGRCVAACPTGAMHLAIEPGIDVLGALLSRVEGRTEIRPRLSTWRIP